MGKTGQQRRGQGQAHAGRDSPARTTEEPQRAQRAGHAGVARRVPAGAGGPAAAVRQSAIRPASGPGITWPRRSRPWPICPRARPGTPSSRPPDSWPTGRLDSSAQLAASLRSKQKGRQDIASASLYSARATSWLRSITARRSPGVNTAPTADEPRVAGDLAFDPQIPLFGQFPVRRRHVRRPGTIPRYPHCR